MNSLFMCNGLCHLWCLCIVSSQLHPPAVDYVRSTWWKTILPTRQSHVMICWRSILFSCIRSENIYVLYAVYIAFYQPSDWALCVRDSNLCTCLMQHNVFFPQTLNCIRCLFNFSSVNSRLMFDLLCKTCFKANKPPGRVMYRCKMLLLLTVSTFICLIIIPTGYRNYTCECKCIIQWHLTSTNT